MPFQIILCIYSRIDFLKCPSCPQVIRPKINITPGIFTLETELEGDLEVTLSILTDYVDTRFGCDGDFRGWKSLIMFMPWIYPNQVMP